jgi:DNA-binding transcriptional ArsR family regulator
MAGSKDGHERRDKEQHYRRAALAHPVRQGILCLMLDGMEAGTAEIAAALAEEPGRIAYHLRVLTRRTALKGIAKDPPAPPYFRLAPQALWARRMLAELRKQDREDDQGGEIEGERP